jgi:hypothetical protein
MQLRIHQGNNEEICIFIPLEIKIEKIKGLPTSMELTEPPHNTYLRHDYTANPQLISRPLCKLNG